MVNYVCVRARVRACVRVYVYVYVYVCIYIYISDVVTVSVWQMSLISKGF